METETIQPETNADVKNSKSLEAARPTRQCQRCKKEKPFDAFSISIGKKDNRNAWCRTCCSEYYSNRRSKIQKWDFKLDEKKSDEIDAVRQPLKTLNLIQNREEDDPQFYKSCFLAAYEKLAAYGVPQNKMEKFFGCSISALKSKTISDEEGNKIYQRAIGRLQAEMASQLLVHAIGFDYTEEKITFAKVVSIRGNPRWMKTKKEVTKKRHIGSPELIIFYLTNRYPDLWKVSRELITKKGETYDDDPGQRDRKKIISLARDILAAGTSSTGTEHPVQNEPASISGEGG